VFRLFAARHSAHLRQPIRPIRASANRAEIVFTLFSFARPHSQNYAQTLPALTADLYTSFAKH
jgi:hypothetical protein